MSSPSTTSAKSRAAVARAERAAFAARAVDALTPLGPVVARRMFGGHGLFLDDAMLALAFDDMLWLKSDPETRALFEAGGARPFVYTRQGKPVELSFLSVPPEVMADRPRLLDWGEAALRAARRARAKRRRQ